MKALSTKRIGQTVVWVIASALITIALLIVLASITANKQVAPNMVVSLASQASVTVPPPVPSSSVPPLPTGSEVAYATSTVLVQITPTEVVYPPATRTVFAQETATISVLATLVAQQPRGFIQEHDFGAWSYKAWREDSGLVDASVDIDSSSVAGLQAFAAANRDLANQLAAGSGDVEVRIVFRHVLSPDEYLAWSASAGLDWYSDVSFTSIDTRGHEGGGSIASDSNDPWPQERVNSFLDAGRSVPYGPITIGGPFYVLGKVAANRLPIVANDPRVFVADVTSNVIRSELEAANVVIADRTFVNPPQIFSAMLALGLENFR
jgi:hypothetical protein